MPKHTLHTQVITFTEQDIEAMCLEIVRRVILTTCGRGACRKMWCHRNRCCRQVITLSKEHPHIAWPVIRFPPDEERRTSQDQLYPEYGVRLSTSAAPAGDATSQFWHSTVDTANSLAHIAGVEPAPASAPQAAVGARDAAPAPGSRDEPAYFALQQQPTQNGRG